MVKFLVFAVCLIGLVSCGENAEKKPVTIADQEAQALKDFKQYEDSLKKATTDLNTNNEVGIAYANKCLDFYTTFPKSKEAPRFLDKAHIIFSSIGLYRRSVQLGETLLKTFPDYKNRLYVIESIATSYDVFLLPREKEKVIYYYELLLKEGTNLPADRKREIQDRIDNADKTFEELISEQAK